MTIFEFFLLVVAICAVIVVIVAVPAILQVKRTVQDARALIETLNTTIPPLAGSLKKTADEIHELTANVNSKMGKTDEILKTAQDSADTLLKSSKMVQNIAMPVLTQISGVRAGVRAFTGFFIGTNKN